MDYPVLVGGFHPTHEGPKLGICFCMHDLAEDMLIHRVVVPGCLVGIWIRRLQARPMLAFFFV